MIRRKTKFFRALIRFDDDHEVEPQRVSAKGLGKRSELQNDRPMIQRQTFFATSNSIVEPSHVVTDTMKVFHNVNGEMDLVIDEDGNLTDFNPDEDEYEEVMEVENTGDDANESGEEEEEEAEEENASDKDNDSTYNRHSLIHTNNLNRSKC